jgi:hypothetical protein
MDVEQYLLDLGPQGPQPAHPNVNLGHVRPSRCRPSLARPPSIARCTGLPRRPIAGSVTSALFAVTGSCTATASAETPRAQDDVAGGVPPGDPECDRVAVVQGADVHLGDAGPRQLRLDHILGEKRHQHLRRSFPVIRGGVELRGIAAHATCDQLGGRRCRAPALALAPTTTARAASPARAIIDGESLDLIRLLTVCCGG